MFTFYKNKFFEIGDDVRIDKDLISEDSTFKIIYNNFTPEYNYQLRIGAITNNGILLLNGGCQDCTSFLGTIDGKELIYNQDKQKWCINNNNNQLSPKVGDTIYGNPSKLDSFHEITCIVENMYIECDFYKIIAINTSGKIICCDNQDQSSVIFSVDQNEIIYLGDYRILKI